MAQARLTWSKLIAQHGMVCEIVRLGKPDVTASIKMMRRYTEEDKLEHEISQRDAWFVMEYTKLEAAGFPFPPEKNDRIKSLGRYYTIFVVEPKIAYNEVVGWQVRCTGGT